MARDYIYILDEPTTGLHFEDIKRLLAVLGKLVDAGNTIVVVEHNLDVIKMADHVIDLGPEGGNKGGEIVAQGPPEEIAKVERSYTGRFLKDYFPKKGIPIAPPIAKPRNRPMNPSFKPSINKGISLLINFGLPLIVP